MAVTEFSFSYDEFKNPKKYKDSEAIATMLTRLLLLEPGTIQSHPDMGVGLVSKYKYSMEGTESELKRDFERQIEKYLPQFRGVKVGVKIKNGTFMISTEIDKTLYGIYYNVSTDDIKSGYTRLSDL